MKTLLTIAGFDPSSGAGVTADLAVFSAHGFFGTSAITALTVQSTLGVRRVEPVAADLLAETLGWLAADIAPAGVKIGMLATAENVRAVAEFVNGLTVPVVLDTVLRSSSGRELLDATGVAMLREELLPTVDWATPNRGELEVLAGMPVEDEDQVMAAAGSLRRRFGRLGLVVTGGDGDASDLVWSVDGEPVWLRGARVESTATHGTGCAFSSALLCGLVAGEQDTAAKAKAYVREGILRAAKIGGGKGPLDLMWPVRPTPAKKS